MSAIMTTGRPTVTPAPSELIIPLAPAPSSANFVKRHPLLSFYVLAAFFRTIHASSEAGLKYFLTGAFGSAFTLYGIALLFGKAGTVRIAALARPDLGADPLVLFGLLLLLVGFGFKMSLAPFHAWAPDVYQGMPTPAVAMASLSWLLISLRLPAMWAL